MIKHIQLLSLSLLIAMSTNCLANDDSSYGTKVGQKAMNGFANMATAVLEIPKNIINTTNESNIVYGLVGGTGKGLINTMGRLVTGVADFVTAPLPTKTYIHPAIIWDDFDKDTTYGETFRLDE